jgi:cytochrome c oxidase assembly protein subunit 15
LLLLIGVVTWLRMPAKAPDAIVASAVGSVALATSWFWPSCDPAPKWLRKLGLIAFAAVVLQGILGGLRVVLFRDQIGILHATLAQLFFALMCAIGLFTSPWWQSSQQKLGSLNTPSKLRGFFLCASLLIFCQLVLGAIMRHEHAGLAIPDFPLAYGKLWPAMDAQSVATYNQHRLEITALNPITAFQIGLQLAHRLVAMLIFGAVLSCAWLAQRQLGGKHLVSRLARVWLGLIIVQISLGAATIWTNKAADLATAHVLAGALSLALGANVCILLLRNPVFARGLKRLASVQAVPATFGSHPAPVVGIE